MASDCSCDDDWRRQPTEAANDHMRPADDIEHAMALHADAVWRVTALYFKGEQDRQDAFQEAYIRYATSDTAFESDEHRKAWLIRVTRNICLDLLKSASRREVATDTSTLAETQATGGQQTDETSLRNDVLDALRALTDPPRTPLYLSVIEEYPATEIAKMMDAPVNTVYSWIARGKKKLREALS
jgi:RNA polymerase sigma factor (sigma-70 family)